MSVPKKMEEANIQLRGLNCPVCLGEMVGKIFTCVQGHSVCDRCLKFVDSCPQCRSDLTNLRNYQLEQLISEFITMRNMLKGDDHLIPCAFYKSGCREQLFRKLKDEHEAKCTYRRTACIFNPNGCKMALPTELLGKHEVKCPHRFVFCQNCLNGCTVRLPARDMPKHEKFCKYVKGRRVLLSTLDENVFVCNLCKKYLYNEPAIYIKEADRCEFLCVDCHEVYNNISKTMKMIVYDLPPFVYTPCKYSNLGCRKIMTLQDVDEHTRNCLRRIPRCESCTCPNDTDDFGQHVKDNHYHVIMAKKWGFFKRNLWTGNLRILCTMRPKKQYILCGQNVFSLWYCFENRRLSLCLSFTTLPKEVMFYKFWVEMEAGDKIIKKEGNCLHGWNTVHFHLDQIEKYCVDNGFNCKLFMQ